MSDSVFSRVDAYISTRLAQEDEVLKKVTQSLLDNHIPDAGISPVQGKLLQVLALSCNAKNILELGTLGGYSSIWLARILPSSGRLITIEFDEKHAAIATENIKMAGLENKVEIKTGRALDILPLIEKEHNEPFDIIFIDADKPPYVDYFKWAIRLGRPGTIIVADNVIRNGKVLDEKSNDEKVIGVQQLNDFLAGCSEVTATILQTVGSKEYDGMVIAVVNN